MPLGSPVGRAHLPDAGEGGKDSGSWSYRSVNQDDCDCVVFAYPCTMQLGMEKMDMTCVTLAGELAHAEATLTLRDDDQLAAAP